MALSDADLDEFIAIYALDFGERLTREEVRPIAERLVAFARLISRFPSRDLHSHNDPAAP